MPANNNENPLHESRLWTRRGFHRRKEIKKEDEICTSSLSSSTIPLTSGIEEAPQLLLSVITLYHISTTRCNPLSV